MSIVAQPAMHEQTIPLHLMHDALSERRRLADMLGADMAHGDVEQFTQVDADANTLLETWAAQLAIGGSADSDVWLNSAALH